MITNKYQQHQKKKILVSMKSFSATTKKLKDETESNFSHDPSNGDKANQAGFHLISPKSSGLIKSSVD